jgi:uncharacterized protein YdaU (DUF1376 family)
MHYYQFNIKDYKAHTDHLSLMEDLAFRRMLDWVYLHEKPLPINPTDIAKRILMPTHSESIEFVLSEFFEIVEDGYVNRTATDNIDSFKAKSEKATKSANMRWNKKPDANDMRTHSEGNANHKPLTTNQLKDKHDLENQAPSIIEEKEAKQDYLEERTLAFEDFWKQWSDNKKMVGKTNTAPKSSVKTKFLNQTFPASKVRSMGIEAFNQEIELMLDLAWNAHADIAKNDKANTESSWFNYRSMYPAKFLSNAQWRDEA